MVGGKVRFLAMSNWEKKKEKWMLDPDQLAGHEALKRRRGTQRGKASKAGSIRFQPTVRA
jgi:hypothetical protein